MPRRVTIRGADFADHLLVEHLPGLKDISPFVTDHLLEQLTGRFFQSVATEPDDDAGICLLCEEGNG